MQYYETRREEIAANGAEPRIFPPGTLAAIEERRSSGLVLIRLYSVDKIGSWFTWTYRSQLRKAE